MNPKIYVGVLVEVSAAGKMRPVRMVWEDGRRFNVDRVLDCRRAVSLKAGGQGTRFTCKMHGKTTYLFNEDGRWFMERQGSE